MSWNPHPAHPGCLMLAHSTATDLLYYDVAAKGNAPLRVLQRERIRQGVGSGSGTAAGGNTALLFLRDSGIQSHGPGPAGAADAGSSRRDRFFDLQKGAWRSGGGDGHLNPSHSSRSGASASGSAGGSLSGGGNVLIAGDSDGRVRMFDLRKPGGPIWTVEASAALTAGVARVEAPLRAPAGFGSSAAAAAAVAAEASARRIREFDAAERAAAAAKAALRAQAAAKQANAQVQAAAQASTTAHTVQAPRAPAAPAPAAEVATVWALGSGKLSVATAPEHGTASGVGSANDSAVPAPPAVSKGVADSTAATEAASGKEKEADLKSPVKRRILVKPLKASPAKPARMVPGTDGPVPSIIQALQRAAAAAESNKKDDAAAAAELSATDGADKKSAASTMPSAGSGAAQPKGPRIVSGAPPGDASSDDEPPTPSGWLSSVRLRDPTASSIVVGAKRPRDGEEAIKALAVKTGIGGHGVVTVGARNSKALSAFLAKNAGTAAAVRAERTLAAAAAANVAHLALTGGELAPVSLVGGSAAAASTAELATTGPSTGAGVVPQRQAPAQLPSTAAGSGTGASASGASGRSKALVSAGQAVPAQKLYVPAGGSSIGGLASLIPSFAVGGEEDAHHAPLAGKAAAALKAAPGRPGVLPSRLSVPPPPRAAVPPSAAATVGALSGAARAMPASVAASMNQQSARAAVPQAVAQARPQGSAVAGVAAPLRPAGSLPSARPPAPQHSASSAPPLSCGLAAALARLASQAADDEPISAVAKRGPPLPVSLGTSARPTAALPAQARPETGGPHAAAAGVGTTTAATGTAVVAAANVSSNFGSALHASAASSSNSSSSSTFGVPAAPAPALPQYAAAPLRRVWPKNAFAVTALLQGPDVPIGGAAASACPGGLDLGPSVVAAVTRGGGVVGWDLRKMNVSAFGSGGAPSTVLVWDALSSLRSSPLCPPHLLRSSGAAGDAAGLASAGSAVFERMVRGVLPHPHVPDWLTFQLDDGAAVTYSFSSGAVVSASRGLEGLMWDCFTPSAAAHAACVLPLPFSQALLCAPLQLTPLQATLLPQGARRNNRSAEPDLVLNVPAVAMQPIADFYAELLPSRSAALRFPAASAPAAAAAAASTAAGIKPAGVHAPAPGFPGKIPQPPPVPGTWKPGQQAGLAAARASASSTAVAAAVGPGTRGAPDAACQGWPRRGLHSGLNGLSAGDRPVLVRAAPDSLSTLLVGTAGGDLMLLSDWTSS